jgi:hypothetical protein
MTRWKVRQGKSLRMPVAELEGLPTEGEGVPLPLLVLLLDTQVLLIEVPEPAT